MPTETTTPRAATPPDVQTGKIEEPLQFPDIQAVILSGYGHLPHAAYLFLRLPRAEGSDQITPAARAALLATLPDVTAANHQKETVKREKTALNLAFTYGGLAALGHSQETLATFSPEFRSGMTEGYRSRALGDVQANDPKNWEWGGTAPGRGGSPDLALLCFAHTHDALTEMVGGLKTRFSACGSLMVAEERSTPRMHGRSEHFGFRDNITSVHIHGGFGVRDPGQSVVAAGEFILGYPNEYGQKTAWPRINPAPTCAGVDVGTNGAYLVFRKLEQDVPAFWDYCRAQAAGLTGDGADPPPPSSWGRRWWGGGAAAPRWPCAPSRTTPPWRATRAGSTTSPTPPATRTASAAPPGRTSAGRTRATRSPPSAPPTRAPW